ncbi:MAG: hypothetical protein M1812_004052 [Candelaria pacifica]|nr:MAG: hypothetical protein M1812_004052 [Candelaria pacifica]
MGEQVLRPRTQWQWLGSLKNSPWSRGERPFSSTPSNVEAQKQQHPALRLSKAFENTARPVQKIAEGDGDEFSDTPTEELYDQLRKFAIKGEATLVWRIINILLGRRHEKANLRLYAALIHVNIDANLGSAAAITKLLKEMKQDGIGIDSGTYHTVLKVLAVHPDYLLRNEILEQMRQRWLTLTVDGWHDVVAGLIREKQFEIAHDKLDHMQQQGLNIHGWLYDMFIYALCDIGELDDALKIIEYRVFRGEYAISATLWYYLLDTASRSFHHEVTRYVWKKRVETDYLNPPSGICLQVLSTAARQGDTELATDVFRILGNRATVFSISHYEALIEAYVANGDLKTCLTILCIMTGAGLEPDEASTRAIYLCLMKWPASIKEAFDILILLRQGGRIVPTAAVNCIIQAATVLYDLPQAMEYYKALHTVCSSGPNTATFNALLRGCSHACKKDQAMFLASEMLALKIRPDALTYDRLMLVCSDQDDYEDAFRYLEEMKAQGYQPRQGTYICLIKKCTERQDERAWGLRQEMEESGLETANTERWMKEHWKGWSLHVSQSSFDGNVGKLEHPKALDHCNGLDLCYVTDQIIATSGPSASYPQLAYRNPLESLVKFLDLKHSKDWAIWEFRAEGTGYPDSEVYNRIWHYPWPDHHPPPFALVPNIMASMRDWIDGSKGRVVVVHCKAGKGRSGTAACSYLISEEGWTPEKALQRFTERRMRTGFGAGVSIPSQLRWIDYVARWTKQGKLYVERQVEILEVHVWSLRDGVKVAVEGYVDEGRTIKTFHVFGREERLIVDSNGKSSSIISSIARAHTEAQISEPVPKQQLDRSNTSKQMYTTAKPTTKDASGSTSTSGTDVSGADVIFRPASRIILPTNDINIDFERRNQAPLNYTFVTSIAHVWFNTFFEGQGAESGGKAAASGVFEIDWDKMDGIKGSSKKGTRALDRLAVVWKIVEGSGKEAPFPIHEPAPGEKVNQTKAADWKGGGDKSPDHGKDLGLRAETPVSRNLSRANSIETEATPSSPKDDDPTTGVRAHGPAGEDHIPHPVDALPSSATASEPSLVGQTQGLGTTSGTSGTERMGKTESPERMIEGPGSPSKTEELQHGSGDQFPDGKPKLELKTAKEHSFGHLKKGNLSDSS